MVSLEGDLEHSGNRLNLNDARLVDIVYAPELTGMENYTGIRGLNNDNWLCRPVASPGNVTEILAADSCSDQS